MRQELCLSVFRVIDGSGNKAVVFVILGQDVSFVNWDVWNGEIEKVEHEDLCEMKMKQLIEWSGLGW